MVRYAIRKRGLEIISKRLSVPGWPLEERSLRVYLCQW
jgi:hypothetical protein